MPERPELDLVAAVRAPVREDATVVGQLSEAARLQAMTVTALQQTAESTHVSWGRS